MLKCPTCNTEELDGPNELGAFVCPNCGESYTDETQMTEAAEDREYELNHKHEDNEGCY